MRGERGKMEGTYDATDYHEPDYDVCDFAELVRVGALLAIQVSDLLQEFAGDVEVKDCRDANGTKESDEKRMPIALYLVNKFMQSKHDWQASKEEH